MDSVKASCQHGHNFSHHLRESKRRITFCFDFMLSSFSLFFFFDGSHDGICRSPITISTEGQHRRKRQEAPKAKRNKMK